GKYTVTLSTDGAFVSRPLVVVADPRVRVTPAALREQLQLTQATIATLKRGMTASQEISRIRDRKDASLPTGVADSLGAIMDAEGSGRRAAPGSRAGVVRDLESADAAPTRGMREAVTAYSAVVDSLLRRWSRVQPMAAGGSGSR